MDCWYSRFIYSNLLATSILIETLAKERKFPLVFNSRGEKRKIKTAQDLTVNLFFMQLTGYVKEKVKQKIRPFFNGKGPKIVSFLKCRPPSTVLNNIPEVKGSGKIENEIPRKPTTKHSDWLVTCKCFHHAMRGKFEKASVAQKHSAFSRQLSFSLLL